MKFYLSSYKVGNQVEQLKSLIPKDNHRFGYVPNALDYTGADPERRKRHVQDDMQALRHIGLESGILDLKEYFGRERDLGTTMAGLGGLWISGGNTFVLRQAMRLSGLDEILKDASLRADFLYGGYSAAGCVLSPDLRAYEIVDNATDLPYPEMKTVLWEGLGLIAFAFLPHFDSNHPESADIDREIEYCKDNNLPYKALRDGEALVIE
ncbi:MAG TPA: Type 1 glutamine amidotransferase-like domain-containing protein [bacterium]|nr:Type 1 glutamine amidotransferase-like domain-containing protein [bacterium]